MTQRNILYKDALAYCGPDEHRTGGAGDHATVDWLVRRCGESGAQVDQPPYQVPGFMPRHVTLKN